MYILKEIKKNKTTNGFFDLRDTPGASPESLLVIIILTYKNDDPSLLINKNNVYRL